MEVSQHSKYFSEFCVKYAVKRKAVGIWGCKDCGKVKAGSAYTLKNGDTYAGEYFADKIHGFGLYRFANGHWYEGAWHEGRRQGCGMYAFRIGDTQSGQLGVVENSDVVIFSVKPQVGRRDHNCLEASKRQPVCEEAAAGEAR